MGDIENKIVNSPCCGETFTFDIEDIHNISDLHFDYAGNYTIIATYTKNGKMFLSISYDCGKTFEPPEEIMSVNGKITNLQVLSRGSQFVIGAQIKDFESNTEIKKAVSGWINFNKMTSSFKTEEYKKSRNEKFCFKTCETHRPKKLINMSLAFVHIPSRENIILKDTSIDDENKGEELNMASIDYVFNEVDGVISIECHIHCGLFR